MTATSTTLWEEYWSTVGNEDWLAARRLLELSPRVRGFFDSLLVRLQVPGLDVGGTEPAQRRRGLVLDWESAADHIDDEGFSSTERRLARLVTALTTGAPLDLTSLTLMSSWSTVVWQVLVDWGTDGSATFQGRP